MQLYESAIWWAENRSVAEAARWLAEIESKIESLVEDAEQYSLARESSAFSFPLHQMNFGVSNKPTHRVLFSVTETQVLVYAIRHLAQQNVSPDDIM